MCHRKRLSLKSASRGIALVELATVLPVMLILIAGTVDVGRALMAYLDLTRAVYEGTRFAGQLAGVEGNGPHIDLDILANAALCTASPHQCSVHKRVRLLIDQVYHLDTRLTGIGISSGFVPLDNTDPYTTLRVFVTVNATYPTLFPFFSIPIQTTASGPFLLRNYCDPAIDPTCRCDNQVCP